MSSAPAIGRALFQWRSYTPIPVGLVCLAWLAWGPATPIVPPELTWARFAAGLVFAAAGQALRAYLMGTVRDGTSGQGSELMAVALNTHGPYRYTRNPLYLGNFLITLGVLFFVGDLVVLGIGAAFFFVQYAFIIRAEERFLAERFGETYAAFSTRVPRFWPRFTPAEPPEGGAMAAPFDWGRAIKKEHNPAFAWITVAVAFWLVTQRTATFALAVLWVALGAAYVWVKLWKKGRL